VSGPDYARRGYDLVDGRYPIRVDWSEVLRDDETLLSLLAATLHRFDAVIRETAVQSHKEKR
jgi:hypothetical protein